MRCTACGSQFVSDTGACAACGAAVPAESAPTVARPDASAMNATRTGPVEPPHFAADRLSPGTIIGRRYRIAGALGRGGMGEVYKAEDLRLGQTVALKFLPARVSHDPSWLARLQTEVRLAREVTHPNVCRVHDLVEADGLQFLSMEYVDGEDLSSLLRRIGRLPADKAVEIAHQLCAGLAAAHARGVLHRDLKPANVMLDGRGRVRITDFGLAAVAGQAQDVSSGTPAYMAPEQALGREASVRSDVYALGLVLYEAFTGRAAHGGRTAAEQLRARLESPPASPSTVVPEIAPAVERAILRCLERDPRARPASALAVAASLPGGDALQAALAAGETPSPEAVAAAGEHGALRPRVALALLGVAFLSILLAYVARERTHDELIQNVRLPLPPEVLADRAHETLRRLGWTERPSHQYYGFSYDVPLVRYLHEADWARLKAGVGLWPAPVYYWYRESIAALLPRGRLGRVAELDPPSAGFGSARVVLDPGGRLVSLAVVPPREVQASAAVPIDWQPLFELSGLDASRLRVVAPKLTPPVPTDVRAAWELNEEGPSGRLHLEGGAFAGRVVNFEAVGPWSGREVRGASVDQGPVVLLAFVLAAAVLVARRNLRLGRADRRGAFRLASFVAGVEMLRWLLTASHSRDVDVEWALLARGFGGAMVEGFLLWAFYVAVEPYVRRFWPESLVAWSRLLAGRARDPLIGRDLLIGFAVGGAALSLGTLLLSGPTYFGDPPRISIHPDLSALSGPRALAATICLLPILAMQVALLYLTLFLLLRMLLRNRWLAALAFALASSAGSIGMFAAWFGGTHLVDWLVLPAAAGLFVFVVSRFGLLALCCTYVLHVAALLFPGAGTDPSAWTAPPFLAPPLIFLALGLWALRVSLGGRPLVGEYA